jgi:hypothetical protein
MTTTLSDMTAKKKPEPSAEELAAKELVRLAKEQGLSLTGPDGLLKQFMPARSATGSWAGGLRTRPHRPRRPALSTPRSPTTGHDPRELIDPDTTR